MLRICDLKVQFFSWRGIVKAVDGVNLEVDRGKIVGLVGETGCGKSATALSIVKLVPPPGRIVHGEIWFEGENIVKKCEADMRKIRGRKISMIFQDPASSLNPVYTVGDQVSEVILLHQKASKLESEAKTVKIFESVRIPSPSTAVNFYPHQLSGGMRQRIMISMAIACNPSLIIADEPTSNLDVTTQAQILELLKCLRKDFDTSILLITHDLGVAAWICDEVYVMYAGNIVESADVKTIYKNPKHPYTSALLCAIPHIGNRKTKLATIEGVVPSLISPPPGCRFHPRCPHVMEICKTQEPRDIELNRGHRVKCFLYN